MIIQGQELDVNILEEIEPYLDSFGNYRIRGNKIQACSPFREERKPSFGLNLDNGVWVDSGAIDMQYYKGNFVSLLAFLRNEPYEYTRDYLLSKYGYVTMYANTEKLKLDINLKPKEENKKIFTMEELAPYYKYRTNYLTNRGISEKCQKAFKIGADKDKCSVFIPWHDIDGNVINGKFRSTKCKYFYYLDGGQLLRNHVYGLHMVRRMDCKEVVIVEAEIDCLTLWSNGIPSLALGHGALSGGQAKLIKNSGIESIIVGGDNDVVGDRLNSQLMNEFLGIYDLHYVIYPKEVKDWNDMTKEQIHYAINNKQKLDLKLDLKIL